MTQIEQQAREWAVIEFPILADGPIAREKEKTIHDKIYRAYLAGYEARGEWKPIDQLPKDRKIICAVAVEGQYWTAAAVSTGGKLPQFGLLVKATHFFELPELPSPPNQEI